LVTEAEDPAVLVDVERLDRWARRHFPGTSDPDLPLEATQISSGASNEIFELRRGGDVWILRRPPRVPLSPTAHDMVREYRVLVALDQTDVPHPHAVAGCSDDSVIGVPFYVMERIDGWTPRLPMPDDRWNEPDVLRSMAFQLVDAIAQLSTVDFRAVGLEGFGKPDGYLERQVNRWLGQLRQYQTRPLPHLEFLSTWLEDNRPPMVGAGIIHGDYQFVNTMFSETVPTRLLAVLDWEQSTVGDPLVDIGWLLGTWDEEGETSFRFEPQLSQLPGMPKRRELAERYAKRSGHPIEHLRYFEVLALFKLGCVMEGSYYRFERGSSTNPRHAQLVTTVPKMFEKAAAVASGELQ
jgi:aminoglycoside phosphotransferase (APT) family kinase protein